MQLEGLGKLKKYHHLIGNRARDLPACSIVPQQTTLLRAALQGVIPDLQRIRYFSDRNQNRRKV
jgi:hypothetical protein